MADITSFVPPAWLEGQDAETIHRRMMQNLPDDIDDTEGGFPWNFTKPTALEKAELLEFNMMETVKIMHYMFAYGIYLDYHAQSYGIKRRKAVRSSGILQITGSPGTVIPEGFLFAVPSSGDTAAITFYTSEEATIGLDGTVDITVVATEAGTAGNVAANTVVIMASPTIIGISSITNPTELTGGAAEEDDETLRQRIKEMLESSDESFVGCDADYKRWAKEVAGVGDAIVIPEWGGAGTVKVVVFDLNGAPANDTIVEDVYTHIVSPEDRDKRLAPIGATVTVVTPTKKPIKVSFKLTTEAGQDRNKIIVTIKSGIEKYLATTREDGMIRRNQIGSIIMSVEGVEDYENLKVNDQTTNLVVNLDEYPCLETLAVEEA